MEHNGNKLDFLKDPTLGTTWVKLGDRLIGRIRHYGTGWQFRTNEDDVHYFTAWELRQLYKFVRKLEEE